MRTSSRTEAILNSMVLSRELMEKYSDLTGYTDKKYSVLYGDDPTKFKSKVDSYSYGKQALKMQADALRDNSCSAFEYTKDGFKAEYEGDKQTLVFFSVPYSSGFTATVNGKAAEVERVNYGFMAVKVPKGKSEIIFSYRTPGFKAGTMISIGAACAYAVYIALVIVFRVRKKKLEARG